MPNNLREEDIIAAYTDNLTLDDFQIHVSRYKFNHYNTVVINDMKSIPQIDIKELLLYL